MSKYKIYNIKMFNWSRLVRTHGIFSGRGCPKKKIVVNKGLFTVSINTSRFRDRRNFGGGADPPQVVIVIAGTYTEHFNNNLLTLFNN